MTNTIGCNADSVHLFEEHCSSLPIWWQLGQAKRTIVYLDAHLDLQKIDDNKLGALRQCRTVGGFRALQSPHHLNTSNRYAFGIENFLYPASRLDLIKRLIWVAPPHIPRRYSSSLLEHVQQMDGIGFEELTGFSPTGNSSLRGLLLGLDVTICDPDDLANLGIDPEYFLDIDVDYFVVTPGDKLWVDPGAEIRRVLKILGIPSTTTISYATSSGFTPMHLRFIGNYLAAVMSCDDDATKHYEHLSAAARLMASGERENAISICRHATRQRPDCAASHYLLATAVCDSSESRDMRQRAEEIDSVYAFDLQREASAFPNRHIQISRERLQHLSSDLEKLTPGSEQRALAEVAIGQLYARVGRLHEAWHLLKKQTGDLANQCDLALDIARGILAGNQPHQAKTLLDIALNADRTRTGALVHLGDLALRFGDIDRAILCFNHAATRAPAWMLPLERLQRCYHLNGDREKENGFKAVIKRRRSRLLVLSG